MLNLGDYKFSQCQQLIMTFFIAALAQKTEIETNALHIRAAFPKKGKRMCSTIVEKGLIRLTKLEILEVRPSERKGLYFYRWHERLRIGVTMTELPG